MLRFSTLRSRLLPSQICQGRVLDVACSAFHQSGPQSNTSFRILIRREQPSRTLCSLVGQPPPKGRPRMASNDTPYEVSEQAGKTLYFGKWKIDPTEVFFTTEHSFAFVNLKPVVPDVLVSPKRVVHRFLDLTPEEASDLWLTAQQVGRKIEPFFKATSLTFAIQVISHSAREAIKLAKNRPPTKPYLACAALISADGAQAGQTVPHVHVHILPRKNGDFENNDEVYDVIDEKEKELSEKLNLDKERRDRTFDEMAAEAAELRALF